jgi:hypothetical protein
MEVFIVITIKVYNKVLFLDLMILQIEYLRTSKGVLRIECCLTSQNTSIKTARKEKNLKMAILIIIRKNQKITYSTHQSHYTSSKDQYATVSHTEHLKQPTPAFTDELLIKIQDYQ